MKYIIGYLIGIQILAIILFFVDKQKAKRNRWRISEKTLFMVAILGGCPGAILGMKLFRHKTKHKKFSIGLPCILIIQIVIVISTVWRVNAMVVTNTTESIYSIEEVDSSIEYILVLGASVYSDGTPSSMLKDRLDATVMIYEENTHMNIIVSGYCSDEYYDEVGSMKNYLLEQGVLEENIIEDYEGHSTYDSIYNLKYVYDIESAIIVTQEYHIYRSLYIAQGLGMEAIGVCSEDILYDGQLQRDVREVLARCKDVVLTMADNTVQLRSSYF